MKSPHTGTEAHGHTSSATPRPEGTRDVLDVLASSIAKLQGLGMEPQHLCRDAFGGMLEADTKAYVKLANELNLKLD